MATYFHGNSEIQTADGLQTLVLMNPSYVQYSNAPPQPTANLVFQNLPHPHAPPHQTHQLVGIPLSAASQDPSSQIQTLHGFAPRFDYNSWNSVDPTATARDTPRSQQGLSLSLNSQQPRFGSLRNEREVASQSASGGSPSSVSGLTNGISTVQSVLMSSKYLNAAQELLEEVVNVGGGVKAEPSTEKFNSQTKGMGESSVAGGGDASNGGESAGKASNELSTAERQEIQMKKAKLITMLDEVEQRYRQYHHQMQIVISSFEQAAGLGSAKTYTALALKTISKQFRCLKDAIMGQIKAANKSLGEEDSSGGKIEGSRLKFVNHHLRQQRALQQLGMIQQNAWRPQRGLPERAVSVLRAWLFEHFLHPYPKDSDKIMLAKQTGLTRSQVSNWFINARVRLWKPMVEEMYLEEMKDQEQKGQDDQNGKTELIKEDSASKSNNAPQDKCDLTENQNKNFNYKQDNPTNQHTAISIASTSPVGCNVRNQSGFSLLGSSELEGITQGSPKKQRGFDVLEANTDQVDWKYDTDQRQNRDGYSLMGGQASFNGSFGQYPIGELGRFDSEAFPPRFSGNSVSLTLGLPHCENLSLSGTHQTFLPSPSVPMGRRVEIGESTDFSTMNPSAPHSAATAFESIDIENRKRFAAQLLPDFVA